MYTSQRRARDGQAAVRAPRRQRRTAATATSVPRVNAASRSVRRTTAAAADGRRSADRQLDSFVSNFLRLESIRQRQEVLRLFGLSDSSDSRGRREVVIDDEDVEDYYPLPPPPHRPQVGEIVIDLTQSQHDYHPLYRNGRDDDHEDDRRFSESEILRARYRPPIVDETDSEDESGDLARALAESRRDLEPPRRNHQIPVIDPCATNQRNTTTTTTSSNTSTTFECIICCNNQREYMVQPCHHLFACADCATRLTHCAICMRQITTYVKVYV